MSIEVAYALLFEGNLVQNSLTCTLTQYLDLTTSNFKLNLIQANETLTEITLLESIVRRRISFQFFLCSCILFYLYSENIA